MTGFEFSGTSPIRERTAQLAAKVGETAAREIGLALTLDVVEGVITENIAENIKRAHNSRATNRYSAERAVGLQNDPRSIHPGLRALITESAVGNCESKTPTSKRKLSQNLISRYLLG